MCNLKQPTNPLHHRSKVGPWALVRAGRHHSCWWGRKGCHAAWKAETADRQYPQNTWLKPSPHHQGTNEGASKNIRNAIQTPSNFGWVARLSKSLPDLPIPCWNTKSAASHFCSEICVFWQSLLLSVISSWHITTFDIRNNQQGW